MSAGTIYDPTVSDEERARLLGYACVLDMRREHDPLHVLLAGLFDRGSPTLRWVASGHREPAHPVPQRHEDVVGFEEALALEVARWLNTGEYGGTMRVLWFLGICPDKLRASLCARLGRDEA